MKRRAAVALAAVLAASSGLALFLQLATKAAPNTVLKGGVTVSDQYQQALSLYNAKNYRAAAEKFENTMKSKPGDPLIIYYCALSSQMANNRSRARQLYEYLSSSFPGTRYASMASSALASMGGNSSGVATVEPSGPIHGGTGYGVSASRYTGPTRFSLPFQRGTRNDGQGGVYIEVLVNNRPMTFHLDTGAGSTMIGANQLEQLGLGRPVQGQTFQSRGVGERQNMKAWQQRLDLKVGNIYTRDFPVMVQDYYEGEPLLGRDFLSDWDVNINESTRQVTFIRKGSETAHAQARGTMDVPFVLEGRHMVVDGFVNGKPYKFYFDTGADGVCFSMNDLHKLDMEDVTATARQGYSEGVGGKTLTYIFPINSLKVGPISRENFQVQAVENSQMNHPLLGQSFFGEYNYQIDEVHKVIHFRPN